MSVKHQQSAAAKWAKTPPEERKRLGKMHSEALKKYWATVPAEQRKRHAAHAANTRHGKIRPLSKRSD